MKESIVIKHQSVYDRAKKKKEIPPSPLCVILSKRNKKNKKQMSLDKSCYKIARVDDLCKDQLVFKSII